MIKIKEIAWLAGLLEGEGCFAIHGKKYPRIVLKMCDEDIVIKAASLMESRIYRNGNQWVTQVNGAYAIEWMMTLYVFFGKRRREAVTEVIKVWKRATYVHGLNGIRRMAKCHSDRLMEALDLCRPCYMKQWKKRQLLKVVT